MNNFKCAYTDLEPLENLKPHPRNPNDHPSTQIQKLAKIIEYAGQRAPIVVSKRSGFITKGHGRLAALTALGWTKAAVDYQDYASDAEELQDMVADNEIARWAEMNVELVDEIKITLGDSFNVDLLGIKPVKLQKSGEEKKKRSKGNGGSSRETECPECGATF